VAVVGWIAYNSTVQTNERRRTHIMGVGIDDVTADRAVEMIAGWVAAGRAGRLDRVRQVATVNPEFLMTARGDHNFRQLLNRVDLATPDGQGLIWAARLLRLPLRQRVPGVETVAHLAQLAAERGYRLYFLGSAEGVAAAAATKLATRYPGFKVEGCYGGSPAAEEAAAICQRVMAATPDVLLVAYGAPAQDKWIAAQVAAGRLRPPLAVAIGVGGAFDFLSGRTVRAPAIMQRLGLEWLHRLYKQPWRWRRILRVVQFGIIIMRRAARKLLARSSAVI